MRSSSLATPKPRTHNDVFVPVANAVAAAALSVTGALRGVVVHRPATGICWICSAFSRPYR